MGPDDVDAIVGAGVIFDGIVNLAIVGNIVLMSMAYSTMSEVTAP